MNILRNEPLIKRNVRIGGLGMLGSLVALTAGMYIWAAYPARSDIMLLCLMLGFILAQVGIAFMNRWGKRPSNEQLLDSALKTLDKRYSLYHFTTPADHLLLGPSGLWVLLPYYQRGNITYSNGRWRQRGGGLVYAYLKLFAREGIGRPDLHVHSQVQALSDYLKTRLPEGDLPPIRAALVFLHPQTTIDIPGPAAARSKPSTQEDAEPERQGKDGKRRELPSAQQDAEPEPPAHEIPPAETVLLSELKGAIQKLGKANALSPERVRQLRQALSRTNTDDKTA